MPERTPRSESGSASQDVSSTPPLKARTEEEARVWKALEEAFQQVKSAAKREAREPVSDDILNFRMKAQVHARHAVS